MMQMPGGNKLKKEAAAVGEPESGFHFKLMSLGFKIRDFFSPRKNVLVEAEIKPGFHLLDYGCGPGGYVIDASEIVGDSGRIYALDMNPLAIQRVRAIVSKKGLANVEAICSDCETGLPDNSVDVVLLYDTFHTLDNPDGVLEELHRVLKPDGVLSFSDHHMKENEFLSGVAGSESFRLSRKNKKTHIFLNDV